MVSAQIRNVFATLAAAAALAALALATASCTRDELGPDPWDEGQLTEVTLRWSTPEMDERTRTALDPDDERTVHSLWIAIYDYETGRIKELTWTENGSTHTSTTGRIIEPEKTLVEHVEANDPINLQTLSGRSRIVAVANIDNYGVSSHDELAGLGAVRLRDLLTQCDTYEKYRSVAALAAVPTTDGSGLNTPNISLTDANMPMAGVYYHTLKHDSDKADNVDWTSDGVNYVDLPAKIAKLPGTIHLRRLHAYVDFHIIPDKNITVEPISWQVHNVPYASWCQERAGEGRNAGDGALLGTGYEENYAPSRLSRIFVRDSKLGPDKNETGMQFSYYQFENKHEGLAKSTNDSDATDYTGVADYKDREREWKNGDTNTGVYKSLTTSAAGDANNMATYVEIEAKVTYYVGTDGSVTTADATGAKPRMGFATYVVHLGYCEGANETAKALDFNCRRNTRYTYTVRIKGLNDIVVEAKREGDTPGVEGEVTDYEGSNVIELDAHYGVFNISMTNKERTNLYWRIKAPYGGGYRILSFADYDGADAKQEDRTDPFYNWIRFKPTSDEKTLAVYREKGIGDTAADAALWTMEDMRDVAGHPNTLSQNAGRNDPTDTRTRWYTVFIDEHAYLLDDTGGTVTDWQQSDWTKYVNQDDRIAWLIVDKEGYKTSTDGESIYSGVKYLISQRSIQTYYSTEHPNDTHTALGVEHFNESYGKNLIWTWDTGTEANLSHSNGRWNMWKYIRNARYNNSTWGNGGGNNVKTWSSIISNTPDPQGYPVAALESNSSTNTYNDKPQPSSTNYYEIIAACMSRNRDLNGDGQIDANELRWYLAAEGKYERIMLGRNALANSLFDPYIAPYFTISRDPYASGTTAYNNIKTRTLDGKDGADGLPTWVHYASSDRRKFFPDEGGSYNTNIAYGPSGYGGTLMPWNIRCVRNLGVTFEEVTASPEDDPVSRAYSFKQTRTATVNGTTTCGGIFDASAYNDNALRGNISSFLPVHAVTDLERNRIARYFEVASKDTEYYELNKDEKETIEDALNANKPCSDHEDYEGDPGGWRVPNQREIMMILTQSNDLILEKETPILIGSGTEANFRYSCTKEAYGYALRISVIGNTIRMYEFGKKNETSFKVRCVRDVTSPNP